MAKNKLNKNWLHDHINDPYVKLAQKEGYRARAAYKLKEIDEQEKLIKPGQVIVDLGCTPGSWGQYVRRKLSGKEGGGINGTIIGLDMLPMEPIADVHFILGDFREARSLRAARRHPGRPQGATWCCRTWRPTCRAFRRPTPRAWSILSIWQLSSRRCHLKPIGRAGGEMFQGHGI